jgi:hypothetical protein
VIYDCYDGWNAPGMESERSCCFLAILGISMNDLEMLTKILQFMNVV